MAMIDTDLPPVDKTTYGVGICDYCHEEVDQHKIDFDSGRKYCRGCAPWRETDSDWSA